MFTRLPSCVTQTLLCAVWTPLDPRTEREPGGEAAVAAAPWKALRMRSPCSQAHLGEVSLLPREAEGTESSSRLLLQRA